MINNFDLYDLYAVFITIRKYPALDKNDIVLRNVLKVLSQDNAEPNQIRKAIAGIEGIDKEIWKFSFTNNEYICIRLIKDIRIYKMLAEICQFMFNLYEQKRYDILEDAADSVHNLPKELAEHHFTLPEYYREVYIEPFRRKWDRNFLKGFI